MILSGNNANNIFYFDKNTLGDIIAIRNQHGVIVAEYEYDAWGNGTLDVSSVSPPHKETTPFNSSAVVDLQTSKLAKFYIC